MTPQPPSSRHYTDAMIRLLHGDYVAYYPRVASVVGGIKAAVMLSQALSWTSGYLRQNPGRQGWFWKTRDEWFQETGLSRWEQETARRHLRELGIWEEKRNGVPAKLFFRLNMDALGRFLSARFHLPFLGWDWNNSNAVREMLGAHVIIYRKLAHALSGVLPALYLSRVIHSHRLALRSGQPEEWLSLPIMNTSNRLGFGRYEALNARRQLTALGLIEEQSEKRVTPRKLTRLYPDRVCEIVLQASKDSRLHKSAILDCTKPRFWNAGLHPTGYLESHRLQSCNPAGSVAAIPPAEGWEISIPESTLNPNNDVASSASSRACENNTDLFTQIKLPLAKATATSDQAAGSGSGISIGTSNPVMPVTATGRAPDLIFPDDIKLLQDELDTAIKFLSFAKAELRQPVLDEWVGQLRQKTRMGKPVGNRLAYLNGIVRGARLGQFYSTVGLQVAAERNRVDHNPNDIRSISSKPASREVIQNSLAQIKAMFAPIRGEK